MNHHLGGCINSANALHAVTVLSPCQHYPVPRVHTERQQVSNLRPPVQSISPFSNAHSIPLFPKCSKPVNKLYTKGTTKPSWNCIYPLYSTWVPKSVNPVRFGNLSVFLLPPSGDIINGLRNSSKKYFTFRMNTVYCLFLFLSLIPCRFSDPSSPSAWEPCSFFIKRNLSNNHLQLCSLLIITVLILNPFIHTTATSTGCYGNYLSQPH